MRPAYCACVFVYLLSGAYCGDAGSREPNLPLQLPLTVPYYGKQGPHIVVVVPLCLIFALSKLSCAFCSL
jgi:hypothetical protein